MPTLDIHAGNALFYMNSRSRLWVSLGAIYGILLKGGFIVLSRIRILIGIQRASQQERATQ